MESLKTWFSMDIPTGWGDVLVRSVKVLLVAFVILQMKELIDAGTFDTPATAIDAALIAAGVFVLNAIIMWVSPRSSRQQRLVRQ
jgi:hypothetical protein